MSWQGLSDAESAALREVASQLQANADDLYNLIKFESGWNPQIKNPTSSARGLVQFMDSTARSMGFPGGSAELIRKYPDRISQLRGPVRQYLNAWKPYPTKQSLYMAVFYPAARFWALTKAFPAAVSRANPGINVVGDYVNYVERRAKSAIAAVKTTLSSPAVQDAAKAGAAGLPVVLLLLVGAGLMLKR